MIENCPDAIVGAYKPSYGEIPAADFSAAGISRSCSIVCDCSDREPRFGKPGFCPVSFKTGALGDDTRNQPPLRQGQPGSPRRQVRAAALLRSSKKNGYPNRHRSLGTVAVLKDTGAKCRKPLRYKDFPDFFRKGPDSFSEKTRMNLPSTVDPPTGVIDLKDTNESLLQKAKKRCRLRRQAMPLVIASALHLFGIADKCFSSSSKEISPKSFPLYCIERFRLVLSVTDRAAGKQLFLVFREPHATRLANTVRLCAQAPAGRRFLRFKPQL